MAVRKIVRIDEEKCNGCGVCVPACAEGAIQIIDGKAKLVSEIYCDGLGACLGECPEDAITIEEREAEEFDEKKVKEHLARLEQKAAPAGGNGCPGARMLDMRRAAAPSQATSAPPALRNWPVQLTLVPPNAPYFQGADLLLAADCVPFAYADFHGKILPGKPLVVGCPKLDDPNSYVDKLSQIITASNIRSLTVVTMEVPCCAGLQQIAEAARARAGKDMPMETIVVGIRGELLQRSPGAAVSGSGRE
jgi:Pyruvate/2-oxoacid:ferredoxin oxidoreductase delta subunit